MEKTTKKRGAHPFIMLFAAVAVAMAIAPGARVSAQMATSTTAILSPESTDAATTTDFITVWSATSSIALIQFAPSVVIDGNNPAHVTAGTPYVDLGARVIDQRNSNIGVRVSVDGVPMAIAYIDTTTPGTHTITYQATSNDGFTTTATRTVVVDPSPYHILSAPLTVSEAGSLSEGFPFLRFPSPAPLPASVAASHSSSNENNSPLDVRAAGTVSTLVVTVVNHVCDTAVRSQNDFLALEMGLDPRAAFTAIAYHCPVITLPTDFTAPNTVTAPPANFSLSVAGSSGTGNLWQAVFLPSEVCAPSGQEFSSGTSTMQCIDLSGYRFPTTTSPLDSISVVEEDPPPGYRLLTARIDPFSPPELVSGSATTSTSSSVSTLPDDASGGGTATLNFPGLARSSARTAAAGVVHITVHLFNVPQGLSL